MRNGDDYTRFVCFDKNMTNIVKGFAIVFMILLHCYEDVDYNPLVCDFSLAGFYRVFKICVGMFTFMVGYGYAFSKTRDINYSISHIKKLLVPFWIILFIFSFPFCLSQLKNEKLLIIVYNLVGIDSTYNYFSWFVYFFIYAMMVLPLLSRFIDKRLVLNTIIVVIFSSLLSVVIHEIPRFALLVFNVQLSPIVEIEPMLALFNCLLMTPGMILGYLFARQEYYEKIRIDILPRFWIFVLCLLIMVIVFIFRWKFGNDFYSFQTDFFYAPLMIGAIVILFNTFSWPIGRVVFQKLGEVSVYMWFLHALFFTTAVSWFYRPMITIFKSVNLVALWTIVLTFLISWLLKTVVDAVKSKL